MSFLTDKTVLVTGAGGSIGTELCKALAGAKKIIAFDNSELALFNLERACPYVTTVLGDVTWYEDIRMLFRLHGTPDIVYHAAACKHVSMCHRNAMVAWRTNVAGTLMMLDICDDREVPKFILVSTDKAVNPTTVMGYHKAQAEAQTRRRGYTVVRLGNVWGSSGSVVQLWKDLIARDGVVEVRGDSTTRFFINGRDAALAIINASSIARGGDTYVPDMGEPRLLLDVARELGARRILITELMGTEKIHEQLTDEHLRPTIFRGLFEEIPANA